MYVCRNGLARLGAAWAPIAKFAGVFFTIAMLVFAVTGGNMFQAWSVADTTHSYFGVPQWLSGLVMAVIVAAVLLGGVKRLGTVADKLVPVMCGLYVMCGIGVLIANHERLPDMFRLIFACAFAPGEAGGAFTGATMGVAFIFGMKRALFSSESGLGTAPMAHAAVKTPEPVTEGVVAGLEPFIDTLVVCTITALVILSSGVWNRGPAAQWYAEPAFVETAPQEWKPASDMPPELKNEEWKDGQQVFVVITTAPDQRERIYGTVKEDSGGTRFEWNSYKGQAAPRLAERGIFINYRGSTLAAQAFDSAKPGLGKWMVTLTVWLFAISTMITYGYYGEQGVTYLGGARFVPVYRWAWVALIAITCLGFMDTSEQLDSLSTVALGFMLAVNLPVMIILGSKAMTAYHSYFRRLKSGELGKGA